MRKKIVAGNWKMNKTPKQAAELCALLKDKVNTDKVDVVFCVPAVDIATVVEAVKGTNIAVGAENMHFEESGALFNCSWGVRGRGEWEACQRLCVSTWVDSLRDAASGAAV